MHGDACVVVKSVPTRMVELPCYVKTLTGWFNLSVAHFVYRSWQNRIMRSRERKSRLVRMLPLSTGVNCLQVGMHALKWVD